MSRRRSNLGSMAYSTSTIHLPTSNLNPTYSNKRQARTKGFNSDDDLRTQPHEVESTNNGNATLGVADHVDNRLESLQSDDLLPSQDVGAGPRENQPLRSSSVLLASSKSDPMLSRRHPVSYSTLQRAKDSCPSSRTRAASPGSEMVTLEQFLQETGQLGPNNVSVRDDLLSDYFKKRSEPSVISAHPNRKEAAKMSTSYVLPVPKKPSDPRASVAQPQPGSSAQPEAPGHTGVPRPREKAPQAGNPPPGNARSCSLTRAHSLASADGLRAGCLDRREAQHRQVAEAAPLSSTSGWRSTSDCRSGGTPHDRPQSARPLGSQPAVSISCRTLDPRRLSLAPPKDEKCLTLPQQSTGAVRNGGISPGSPSPTAAARVGDVALVSPVRATCHPSSEPRGRGQRSCEDLEAAPRQSRAHEYIDPMTGADDASKRGGGGAKGSPGSPETGDDQQTVWYEYGCV